MHEVFLKRLVSHPKFRDDHTLQVFLEYEQDVSKHTKRLGREGQSKGKGGRVGQGEARQWQKSQRQRQRRTERMCECVTDERKLKLPNFVCLPLCVRPHYPPPPVLTSKLAVKPRLLPPPACTAGLQAQVDAGEGA